VHRANPYRPSASVTNLYDYDLNCMARSLHFASSLEQTLGRSGKATGHDMQQLARQRDGERIGKTRYVEAAVQYGYYSKRQAKSRRNTVTIRKQRVSLEAQGSPSGRVELVQ